MPRQLDGVVSRLPNYVRAGGIAEFGAKIRQHGIHDGRINGRRGIVIEIDRVHEDILGLDRQSGCSRPQANPCGREPSPYEGVKPTFEGATDAEGVPDDAEGPVLRVGRIDCSRMGRSTLVNSK